MINKGLGTGGAVLSLKKNRSLGTIVLHYKSVDEVEEDGFGFNGIELLVMTNAEYGKVRAKVDEYKSSGLINKMVLL